MHETQYGFRRARSTAQAIFLARRLMDMSERQGTNLAMILLDWEKAFDKIDHDRLLEALGRLNVPDKLLKCIDSIYKEPRFKVVSGGNESSYKHQATGRRQGCPLSPFFFYPSDDGDYAWRKDKTHQSKGSQYQGFVSQMYFMQTTRLFLVRARKILIS